MSVLRKFRSVQEPIERGLRVDLAVVPPRLLIAWTKRRCQYDAWLVRTEHGFAVHCQATGMIFVFAELLTRATNLCPDRAVWIKAVRWARIGIFDLLDLDDALS